MKKLFLVLLGIMFFTPAWADPDLSMLLNKVSLQLRVNKWVTTKTANVVVGVNASVADAGIEKIQNQVLGQLAQLSNLGEWHIVNYNRQQDKSGLETIQISAEARLPQSELVNLRSKAKSISKPGITFTIDDVQFTPSDDEITEANVTLRGMIYQQARMEVDALNKVYPEQKFYLHRIDFNMMPVMPMAGMAMKANMLAAEAAAPLNVGNKMEMMATVTVAAMPDMLLTKKTPLIN